MNIFKLLHKIKDILLNLFEDLTPKLKTYFFTGLLIVVPAWFTLFVVTKIFKYADGFLGKWIADNLGARIPGLGLLVTLLAIAMIGLIGTNLVGRQIVELFDNLMSQLPMVRNLYTGAKQISSIVIKGNKFVFEKVALIEYPRRGIYCLAFVTGEASPDVVTVCNDKCLNIFLPTTPNPTSGFFLMLPENDVTILNITPEEGIKLIISGGLVEPDKLKDS